ncbi:MAG: Tad domain-containing protein, partial [Deltaproteobacteria bacterium]|nr:Tad domain-containing protein [Deltaproteobacteria bacterium]
MKSRIQPSELLTVRRREDGQILVMGLFMIVGLVLAAFSVVNVGMMVSERVRVQNAVDASAYSSAVVQARYMNLAAYVNRAIVANYNSMAFNMGLWATVDAFDHGSAAAVGTLYGIASVFSETGVAYFLARTTSGINKGFHKPMHSFNRTLLSALGDNDFNQYIERYNTDVLSMYQGILLAAAQGIRYQVAQNVAATMDPDVKTTTLLGLGAEASNFDELRSAVDYAIGDVNRSNGVLTNLNKLFDSLGGDARPDTQLMLASVNETSLDRFAGGRLRKSGKQDFLRNMNTGDLL